jgi:hypothetical protein
VTADDSNNYYLFGGHDYWIVHKSAVSQNNEGDGANTWSGINRILSQALCAIKEAYGAS